MSRDQLIAWLDDGYAMETGLGGILDQHANAKGELAELVTRRRQHANETRVHAQRIREWLAERIPQAARHCVTRTAAVRR